ncbi:hypothetical protein WOLCODRAFT_109612 [Wolfiporia cocos MD-104 SS10]|uniref:Uncharacterized protein n=1 Tax=Wolfiporia cocos (strain MD-104) TaxID=742152 RepID=A0A2H3JKE0_WOLCO|nr:hypothetical protein WOLCODRAFT_109612 [Wolfiporia cocos MD-104 SS10]
MLPTPSSSQGLTQQYASSHSFTSLNYPDISNGFITSSQPFSSQSSLHSIGSQAADPNSPEAFRQNVQLVLVHVNRVQSLARSALAGIEHAYHPGINPNQTTADMAALYQVLQSLADILRQTGVGALSLNPPDLANPPQEELLINDATRAIQALYERYKQVQESAGVVASLLNVTDQAGRRQ